MTNTADDSDEPSSSNQASAPDPKFQNGNAERHRTANGNGHGIFHRIKSLIKGKSDTTLRETIEEFIDAAEHNDSEITSITAHERTLIANILKLRDQTAVDVMIPRADIFAIDIDASQQELLSMLAQKQYSRIPVYRGSLDDVVGTIHIKDILSCLADGREVDIENLIRDVPIVSPSMQVLDLLLLMKQIRRHMALVVDEFGGIDGLVTINDVIEDIVGEIEDEYDQGEEPQIIHNNDGTFLADARLDIEDFEEQFGEFLTEEEREDVDTLGGLVSAMTGRVPARGEILTHPSGMVFEVIDADPRRVNRLLIKNIPLPTR